jgi:hypothetical protein
MGGDADRALCRLSSVRMLMHGECYRRPDGQQQTYTRDPPRYRTHDRYPGSFYRIYTKTTIKRNESEVDALREPWTSWMNGGRRTYCLGTVQAFDKAKTPFTSGRRP